MTAVLVSVSDHESATATADRADAGESSNAAQSGDRGAVVVLDVDIINEDVPGGASAYLLDDVLNRQGAWNHLDGQAKTLTAKPHLPAYGSDGDYFSKPSVDDIVESAYNMLREVDPEAYPSLR